MNILTQEGEFTFYKKLYKKTCQQTLYIKGSNGSKLMFIDFSCNPRIYLLQRN